MKHRSKHIFLLSVYYSSYVKKPITYHLSSNPRFAIKGSRYVETPIKCLRRNPSSIIAINATYASIPMSSIVFKFENNDIVENSTCLCCGNNQLMVISRVYSNANREKPVLETSICDVCAHVQRTRILSEDWMLGSFKLRDKLQQNMGFSPIVEDVEIYRKKRYAQLGDCIINLFYEVFNSKPKALLDIGCGTGLGLLTLEEKGLNTTGIEPDPSRVRVGRMHELDIRSCTWNDFFSDANKEFCSEFDLVTTIASFEHFYKPLELLSKIQNYTSNKTCLYLEVPEGPCIHDWNDSLYQGHVNNFSENSLYLLLREAGFKSIFRVSPYSDKSMNTMNLCIFALKSSTKVNKLNEFLVDEWTSEKISKYVKATISDYTYIKPSKGDPYKANIPMNIKVDELNDLMMIYKPDPFVIMDTVERNAENRSIVHIKADEYRIC